MNNRNFIQISFNATKVFFQQAPAAVTRYALLNAAFALSRVVQTISLQFFFDTAQAVSAKRQGASALVYALLFMGGAYLLYHLLDGISECASELLYFQVSPGLHARLFRRVGGMKAEEFEDANRLDAYEKARNGAETLPGICYTILDTLFFYGIYLLFMGWYLFAQQPLLAFSLVILFLPVLLSKLITASLFQELEEKEAPLRREANYYETCLAGRETAKETRILGANSFFEKRYDQALQKLRHFRLQVVIRQHLIQILLHLLTACGYGLIVWMLFSSVMGGAVTLGAFAAVLASLGDLFRCMNKLVTERFGWLTEHAGAVRNYLRFTAEPFEGEPMRCRPAGKDLLLENVSFTFPQADEKALSNLNLRIRGGQIVALVGENGSGKTTLARLLTGLYAPTEGTVTYDGRALQTYSREGISAVFQKYGRYQMTLRENLSISRQFHSEDAALTALCNAWGIRLDMAGAKEHQPDADPAEGLCLDTMLGREFHGTELSGGQWQRIAIGRGLYRPHDLILLDEPTAAIDPLEETRIYRAFAQVCKGKTAVLITHRLGSARLADRILVLKGGKIVQDGIHDELVGMPGEYRRLYEAQAKWYTKNRSSQDYIPCTERKSYELR